MVGFLLFLALFFCAHRRTSCIHSFIYSISFNVINFSTIIVGNSNVHINIKVIKKLSANIFMHARDRFRNNVNSVGIHVEQRLHR